MAKTPGKLPYPVGTDKVVDGDNAIMALATAMRIWSGVINFGSSAGAKFVDKAIVFPAGLFTSPPVVVCTGATISSGDPVAALIVNIAVGVPITVNGCTLRMTNTANNPWSSTSYSGQWIAFQNPA